MLDPCFTEFKLDLPGTKNFAPGHALTKHMAAGGHKLRVDCYPGGHMEIVSEYISLIMCLQVNAPYFTNAIFEAFVVGAHGEPSPSLAKRSTGVDRPWVSSTITRAIVWAHLVKRTDLESLQTSDGVVRLVCGVVVLSDGAIAVPASDIGDHLGRMLDRTDGSDVSFSVGGETFHAHRAVLAARSPVFQAELFGSMAEARMPCITVNDIDHATFKALLRFMYTDSLPEDAELAGPPMDVLLHLLVAADSYALDRLKLVCASRLREIVTADTVPGVLVSAMVCNCPELKESCMDFFVDEKNFKRAMLTEDFGHLLLKFPSIITELRGRAGI